MNAKIGLMVSLLMGVFIAGTGAAEVRNVTAEQRWAPWNGQVEIQYEVVGTVPTNARLAVVATDLDKKVSYMAATNALSGDTGQEEGKHRIVWNMDCQSLSIHSDNVTFSVTYSDQEACYPGTYCVIDLSEGTNAVSYPVTYVTNFPDNGINFNQYEYKTTKLVLRRIEPGSFVRNAAAGDCQVTLTEAFFMGVFEVTQNQYELVMGYNPSKYQGSERPVECVSWNTIRGDSEQYNWPETKMVDTNSFIGRLQTRTGLDFDLPTEAQWEYACRAGTTSCYNNGSDSESDMLQLDRCWDNQSDRVGGYSEHTKVGCYRPNTWGLYNMQGNVEEWCVNWDGDWPSDVTNPNGPSSGTVRVILGGGWRNEALECSLDYYDPRAPSGQDNDIGFRLARTVSE